MPKRAYIDVNADGLWALYAGDGSDDEPQVLAVGEAFEPGAPIREVMDALQAWADANDTVIIPPDYSKQDANFDDLFNDN